MSNARPISKSCRKCGAAPGEECRHSRNSKKDDDAQRTEEDAHIKKAGEDRG